MCVRVHVHAHERKSGRIQRLIAVMTSEKSRKGGRKGVSGEEGGLPLVPLVMWH